MRFATAADLDPYKALAGLGYWRCLRVFPGGSDG
jgi:hypothetical protein